MGSWLAKRHWSGPPFAKLKSWSQGTGAAVYHTGAPPAFLLRCFPTCNASMHLLLLCVIVRMCRCTPPLRAAAAACSRGGWGAWAWTRTGWSRRHVTTRCTPTPACWRCRTWGPSAQRCTTGGPGEGRLSGARGPGIGGVGPGYWYTGAV